MPINRILAVTTALIVGLLLAGGPIAQAQDATIEKEQTAGPEEVGILLSEPTVFEFTITYSGPAATVEDTVPAEYVVNGVEASAGDASFAKNGNGVRGSTSIEWNLPNPADGATLVVEIQTAKNPGKRGGQGPLYMPSDCGELLLNDGAVAVAENGDLIAGPTDSLSVLATDRVEGSQPCEQDLALSKTVDDANPAEGDEIAFTLTVEHLGPTFVEDVEVTDMLPEGVSFVGARASQGSYDADSGVWQVGTLDADGIEGPAEATLEIRVTVNDGTSGQTIENVAEITNASKDDPDLSNNQDSASFTVQ